MESQIMKKSRPVVTSPEHDVSAKCKIAKELENSGDFEAAQEAFAGLWRDIGQRPNIENLPEPEQAEVLLRVGALSGWLGSSGQVPGAQGFAKDLISESLRIFEGLANQDKIAEAQTDLAICYWREGAMDEARVWFHEALSRAVDPANRLRVLVNSTIVEYSANRLNEALTLLDQATPLLDLVDDPAARGRYHLQRGLVLQRLGGAENFDRALIEDTAASIHFEKANHRRYYARVENNIGEVLLLLGRYEDALEHLERARYTFVELNDVGSVAQVNETGARVFLAQERYVEAEKIAFSAASALETGGEYSLLAEALEAQGIALARMGRYQSALSILKRAANTAEDAGHSESAGRAFLTIIEELKSFLAANDIGHFYREADRRLGDQTRSETLARLRACARLVASNAAAAKPQTAKTQASFQEEVLNCESDLIRRALDEANGSVTRAAKILGLTHQGLCYIINHRHKTLLAARAPIRVRRKSLIKKR